MDEMISLRDLTYFILFALAIVVGVYLVMVLNNVNKLVKRVNQVVEDNKVHIDKTLTVMPDAANNLNQAAVSIQETVGKAGFMMGNLEGTVTEAAATMGDTTESILDIVKAVVNAVKTIMALLSKD